MHITLLALKIHHKFDHYGGDLENTHFLGMSLCSAVGQNVSDLWSLQSEAIKDGIPVIQDPAFTDTQIMYVALRWPMTH